MTTWVDTPGGGRDRGPRAVARAWAEVLVRPRRFFRTGVAPGDQAPALVFGAAVGVTHLLGRLALAPASLPRVGGPLLSGALLVALVALVLAPAALHFTAAIQTVILMALVPERGGISLTVQTVAYASAPCALAGPPVPALRLLCAAYGAVLLAVGLAEVHDAAPGRALLAAAVPAALLFGGVFGGGDAARTVLADVLLALG